MGDVLPQFIMRLRDRRVQVSYPVRLTCQTVAWPIPHVTWYKEGIEIEQNGTENVYWICSQIFPYAL